MRLSILWDTSACVGIADTRPISGNNNISEKMKYEDRVRKICGEDWNTISEQEKQGGYGVACLLAYMKGARPSLPEISKHLEVTADEISVPFVRLLRNGAFNRERWDSKNDRALLGEDGEASAHHSWGFVAAVSSGFLGVPC